jgi:hypothetical protein
MASTDRYGYGQFRFEGKILRAHRVAYELEVGPIPEGMKLLHSCDNRRCVKPQHLTPGTMAQNNADMNRKGRNPWQQHLKYQNPDAI